MRNLNAPVLTTVSGLPTRGCQIDSRQLVACSFMGVVPIGQSGTISINVSNDTAPAGNMTAIDGYKVTNWIQLPGTSMEIVGGTPAIIPLPSIDYRWMQAAFAPDGIANTYISNNPDYQFAQLVFTPDGTGWATDNNHDIIFEITDNGNTVTWVAGVRGPGYANGNGKSAIFDTPIGVAIDPTGTFLCICDTTNYVIRKMTVPGLDVTLYAGTPGVSGYVNGPIDTALFNNPLTCAFDPSGNLYVDDQTSYIIRKVLPNGVVSLYAGTPGVVGHADGVGSAASFGNNITAIASDALGNIYVADGGNSTVRKIAPGGIVTTLAGTALVTGYVDAKGPLARFANLQGIVVDLNGLVWVTDGTPNNAVRVIYPDGTVVTALNPNTNPPYPNFYPNPGLMGIDPSGLIYWVDSYEQIYQTALPPSVNISVTINALGI